MIYFSSDSHHGHYNIIKYCNRPFTTVEEMDETIINNFNEVIMPNDTLYFLGDFSFGPQAPFRERINCNHIHLIRGNHDRQVQYNLFESVKDLNEYRGSGISIVLCHFAMRVWNKKHHGSWHLFGHSHGTIEDFDLSFDCGVDTNNFMPYSLDDVVKRMEAKINVE